MKGWEGLINEWQTHFFILPLYFLLSLLALVICIIYHRKEKIGVLFITYLLFDLIVYLNDDYRKYFSHYTSKETLVLISLSNGLIYIIEFFVYSFFFLSVLKYKTSKRIVKIFLLLFGVATIYYLGVAFQPSSIHIRKLSNFFSSLEYLFLTTMSLLYYFELFSLAPKDDILKKPSFWITNGIFIMCLISLPYILIDFTLAFNKKFNRILVVFFFYMPICFNSIFLTKALLCKKPLSI